MLAVLAGALQRPEKPPPRLNAQQWCEARRSKGYRWLYATELRQRGASLRSIARQVGASPATVLRDLRRSQDWASDQHDREDKRETRQRLRERQGGGPSLPGQPPGRRVPHRRRAGSAAVTEGDNSQGAIGRPLGADPCRLRAASAEGATGECWDQNILIWVLLLEAESRSRHLDMVRRERAAMPRPSSTWTTFEAAAGHHEDPGATAQASARARGRQPTGWP